MSSTESKTKRKVRVRAVERVAGIGPFRVKYLGDVLAIEVKDRAVKALFRLLSKVCDCPLCIIEHLLENEELRELANRLGIADELRVLRAEIMRWSLCKNVRITSCEDAKRHIELRT